MEHSPANDPHRRFNPLTGDWVLVSPHRTQRPWQGQTELTRSEKLEPYEPKCYLCPENERANGERNPPYTSTFVFTNDYPAVIPNSPDFASGGNGPLRWESAQGECRVVCFSPRHDLTLAEMDVEEIEKVVQAWVLESKELGDRYGYVQVFENKGEAMGCSNPHPHGQIWATDAVPTIVQREDSNQRDYQKGNLLLDCLKAELEIGDRIVEQNEHWVLLVPFWAVWPFEYLLVPRRHVLRLPDLTVDERRSLAAILKLGLVRYDKVISVDLVTDVHDLIARLIQQLAGSRPVRQLTAVSGDREFPALG